MGHVANTVTCASCSTKYCMHCHRDACPDCGSSHIESRRDYPGKFKDPIGDGKYLCTSKPL